MFNNISKGKIGEKHAIKHLINNSYIVVEKNYRTRVGEIDIIARDKDVLVFIEVKSRTSLKFGYPREAVDYHKQKKIRQVAEIYLLNNKIYPEIRFDVVEIFLTNDYKTSKINIIKNAF